jgi:putative ABC transport system permease protein
MVRGLPQDLDAPMRVAVDVGDLRKLQIDRDPVGATLDLNGVTAYIVGLSAGVRSFTLTPYVFASADTARRVLRMKRDQASYWVADLRDPRCADDVVRAVRAHPDLDAHTAARFAEMTQDYWVAGSGAGAALGFSALLGLVVGVVIVGQTLYAVTREHLRELATLKAVGASDIEITGFVAWQALFLAGVGGALGLANTWVVRGAIDSVGISVELSPAVLGVGAGAVALMCALASLWSVRAVLTLEAAEVFK